METCTNCGKLIGARQSPEVIQDKLYCEICGPVMRKKLAPSPPPIPYATPMPAPPPAPQVRIYGLTWSESWIVGILGLLLAPAGIGVGILIWVWLSQRQHHELRQALRYKRTLEKFQPPLDSRQDPAH